MTIALPVALLLAATAVSSGVSYLGQKQQADAANQRYKENARNAALARVESLAANNRRYQTQLANAKREGHQRRVQALKAKAFLDASATSAGVGAFSPSVLALQYEYNQQLSGSLAALEETSEVQRLNALTGAQQINTQFVSNRNALPQAVNPSPLLAVADAGAKMFGQYMALTYKPPDDGLTDVSGATDATTGGGT